MIGCAVCILLKFTASKEVADLHCLLYVFLCILGEEKVFKAPADIGDVFAVVVRKGNDVSAVRDNNLKKLIPKSSVGSCYIVGVVDDFHTETASVIIEYVSEIADEHIPV